MRVRDNLEVAVKVHYLSYGPSRTVGAIVESTTTSCAQVYINRAHEGGRLIVVVDGLNNEGMTNARN